MLNCSGVSRTTSCPRLKSATTCSTWGAATSSNAAFFLRFLIFTSTFQGLCQCGERHQVDPEVSPSIISFIWLSISRSSIPHNMDGKRNDSTDNLHNQMKLWYVFQLASSRPQQIDPALVPRGLPGLLWSAHRREGSQEVLWHGQVKVPEVLQGAFGWKTITKSCKQAHPPPVNDDHQMPGRPEQDLVPAHVGGILGRERRTSSVHLLWRLHVPGGGCQDLWRGCDGHDQGVGDRGGDNEGNQSPSSKTYSLRQRPRSIIRSPMWHQCFCVLLAVTKWWKCFW